MLEADHVHIWLADPEDCHAPALVARYLAWLDEQEQERYHRFKFDRHRHTFLVAHALLRWCLAQYSHTQPASLAFTRTPQGRPELLPAPDLPPLRFSLSHTTGLVACGIVQTHDLGLDVEDTQRRVVVAAVARTSFTPQEQQELHRLAPAAQRHYFFDHWTLKEAYAKARGLGLYLPFREFGFQLQAGPEPAIQLRPTNPQTDKQDWHFAVCSPTPTHRLALAIRSSQAVKVSVYQGIPGSHTHRLWPQLTHSRGVMLVARAGDSPGLGLG